MGWQLDSNNSESIKSTVVSIVVLIIIVTLSAVGWWWTGRVGAERLASIRDYRARVILFDPDNGFMDHPVTVVELLKAPGYRISIARRLGQPGDTVMVGLEMHQVPKHIRAEH